MSDIGRIRAVSFDADMTLWDLFKVMRHSLGHALTELRRRAPCRATDELTIDEMIDIRNDVAARLKGQVVNLEEIRLRAFQRTVALVGSEDEALAEELNAIYLKHRFEDIELYPDVLPILDALAPRYALGLLTNGNTYPERCGLPGRFAFVVLAQDVGWEKPDERIFLEACTRAGCQPQELVHVGDSLESDVDGANRVGAISVWLNRDHRPGDPHIHPTFEIHSLSELGPILDHRAGAQT